MADTVRERSRAPVVAGLFYPDDWAEAEQCLKSFGLRQGIGGTASAIIAPHGAWDISGAAAGAAFAAAAGRMLSQVVILGNLHSPAAEGIFLSDSRAFETPLGNLPVHRDLGYELAACGAAFHINDIPHLQEHAVEVLLPFIKFCFPRCAIVPILIGGARPALILALARALRIVFEPLMPESLLVVSANLAKNADEGLSRNKAEFCVSLLEQNKPSVFSAGIRQGRINPCGGAAIAALLESELIAGKRGELLPGSLLKTKDEDNHTVYYAGIAFV